MKTLEARAIHTPEYLNRFLAGRRKPAKGLHISKDVGDAKALADRIVG